MSTYRWAVEHTGRPFAAAIPEDAWRALSKHTTLKAAERRVEREAAEDEAICGPGAWRDHYRIVALCATVMVSEHLCHGYLDRDAHTHSCDESATTRWTWPAGEARPAPLTPEGWASPRQCAACAALERIERAAFEREADRMLADAEQGE